MTRFLYRKTNKQCRTGFLAFVLLALLTSLTSMGQSFQASYGAPASPLQVCGSDAEFLIRINSGGTAITGATMRVTLPVGYAYTDGSASYVSGGTGPVTDTQVGGNINVFDLIVNIPASGSIEIRYRAAATCAVIGSTGSGFATYQLRSGTGNPALPANISEQSSAINFENAKLIISNVTNKTYAGTFGSSYTRDITIVNTGYGIITGINLSSSNSSGFTISSPSVLSSTGSGDLTITVSGTAPNQTYTVAGVTLDKDENIVIRENVTIGVCNTTSLTTSYDAYFGCTAKCTQSTVNGTETAGASVTQSRSLVEFNSANVNRIVCRGTDQTQMFSYKNNGTGTAQNVVVTIVSNTADFASLGTSAIEQIASQSGFKNLEYQVGSTSGSWTALTTFDNIYPAGSVAQNCLTSAGAPIRAKATLPDLAPDQVIYIRYVEVTCCMSGTCQPAGTRQPSTQVQIDWTDPCGGSNNTGPKILRYRSDGTTTITSFVPSDLIDGQKYNFKWDIKIPGADVTFNGGRLKIVVTLPAGIVTPTVSQVRLVRGNFTNPSSFEVSGNVLTVIYEGITNFQDLDGAYFQLSDVVATCAGVTTNGASVQFDMYAQQPSCGCEIKIGCTSSNIGLHCASCTKGGLVIKNFSIKRISYGLGDSDNDGYPDGVLDLSKIRTDISMAGDTLEAVFNGKFVAGATALPALTHAYAHTTFDKVTPVTGLNAKVEIYVAGSSTATYTTTYALPVVYSAADALVDFSIDVLHAHGVPSSYTEFGIGDSVVVKALFFNTSRASSPATTNELISLNSNLYASAVANPTVENDKYGCDSFKGAYSYVTFYEAFGVGSTTNSNVCGEVTIQFYYIEDVAATFPYEYRPLLFPKTWRVTVPNGYTYKSANARVKNLSSNVTPVDANANTLVFDLVPYFVNGAFRYPEAYSTGVLNVTFSTDCNESIVTSSFNTSVDLEKTPYTKADLLPQTLGPVERIAIKNKGIIEMTSPQASITSTSENVSWIIALQNATSGNNSGLALPNTWLASQSATDLTITSVEALASSSATSGSVIIPTAGGIYQLGNLAGNGAVKYYKVSASLSNCDGASINLAYGFQCEGYPADVNSAICKKNFTLKAAALPLSLQLTILGQPGATEKFDLCDDVDYEVQVLNPSQIIGTNLRVVVSKPSSGGIVYGAGSAYVNAGNGYVLLDDANIENTVTSMVFNIPADILPSLGLSQTFSLRFKGRTTACEFVSGSSLRFRPGGMDVCGTTKLGDNKQSNPIKLTEAPDTYNTFKITSDIPPVVACGVGRAAANYHFRMQNNNALTTLIYGFEIEVPAPWGFTDPAALTFASGSYTNVTYLNVVTNPAGNKVYSFSVAAGLDAGAFIEFRTELSTASAAALSCGLTAPIRETVTLAFEATCSVDNTVCLTKQIVSENEGTSIQVDKPVYKITGLTAVKDAAGTGLTGTVTIVREKTTYVSQNATLKLYKDIDNSGNFTPGDVLLGTQIFPVADQATQAFNYAITSSSLGNICPLVAVIDMDCACVKSIEMPLACNIALPVSLVSFTGKSEGTQVKLKWETVSELNNDYFEVEHSVNSRDFESIGKVQGSATTLARQVYGFVHENASVENVHYYRLKQVDFDGQFQYSRIIAVKLAGYKGLQLVVTPNPVTDSQIKVYVDYGDNAMINKGVVTLFDLNGRPLSTRTLNLKSGRNEVVFTTSSLASGVYLISLENESLAKPLTVKVILIK